MIYTTDNGFFLGDHGWYDKRFMYDVYGDPAQAPLTAQLRQELAGLRAQYRDSA